MKQTEVTKELLAMAAIGIRVPEIALRVSCDAKRMREYQEDCLSVSAIADMLVELASMGLLQEAANRE